ncbi:MAG: hypothetical protein ACYCW6_10800 [Candidatus Xenobia bacterium]
MGSYIPTYDPCSDVQANVKPGEIGSNYDDYGSVTPGDYPGETEGGGDFYDPGTDD